MKLIIGLGNPGKNYAKTRHNIGFMVLDFLHNNLDSETVSVWELSKKFNAEIAGGTINSQKIIFAKPMTFMNSSGITVQLIANFYKIPPSDIIVIHDDKDLKLGEIKVQTNRGDAGHNGVKSIIEHIGTQNFTRIRIGIANDKMKDVPKFVLGKFGLLEKSKVTESLKKSSQEIRKLL